MKLAFHCFILIFIQSLSSFDVFAQTPVQRPVSNGAEGKVTGIVVDAVKDHPLEYATIGIIKAEDSVMVTGGVTDSKGRFSVPKVPLGKYYLRVHFMGFKKFKSSFFTIGPGNENYSAGTIRLESASKSLGEVEVVAGKEAVEYSLDKKIINVGQNIASAGGTAIDLLQTIPSVTVDIDGNVSLRGSTAVTILVDGRPSGLVSLDQLPASMIERIEIITNPSARYDPDGMAGILNIVLKRKQDMGFNGISTINLGTGKKFNSSNNFNIRYNKLNLSLNYDVRMFAMKGFSELKRQSFLSDSSLNLSQNARTQRSGTFHNVKAGVDYYINDKNTLSFTALYNVRPHPEETILRNTSSNTSGEITDDYTRYTREESNSHGGDFTLNYRKEFDDKAHLLTVDAFLTTSKSYDNTSYIQQTLLGPDTIPAELQRGNTHNTNTNLTLQLDYVRPLGKFGRIETGYKSSFRNNDMDYILENYMDGSSMWLNDTTTSNHFIYKDQVHAIYFTYAAGIGNLKMQAGVRLEDFIVNTEQRMNGIKSNTNRLSIFPSAVVRYDFTTKHYIQLSYSKRVNRPGARQLNPFIDKEDPQNLSSGNPLLKPEYIHALELGHSLNFLKTSINTTIFFRYINGMISRLITLNNDGTTFSFPRNLDNGYSYGAELVLAQDIAKWWKMNINGSLFRSSFNGSGLTASTFKDNFTWTVKANTFITIWKTDFQVSFVYNAPKYTVQNAPFGGGGQGKQSAFYFVDLGVKRDILKGKGTINIRLSDVFKTQRFDMENFGDNFTSHTYRYRDSRVLYVGFTYRIRDYKKDRSKKKMDDNSDDME